MDDTTLVSDSQCADAGFDVNADFVPGLVPYDLSRGGGLFQFNGDATINQQAFYAQDDIKAGQFSFKLGVRFDHYDGLTTKSLVEPRLGVSYATPHSNTILRASYGRTLETPYNENLVLASSADAAVFGTGGLPLPAGTRDQVDVGIQQAFGRWVVVDVGYFYKHTTNGYDFGTLFDTPIFFPVSWDHSKLDGVIGRVNLVEHNGFSAFTVLGHNNAIFHPPGTGGILLEQPEGTFRIDHDQKFQQTTNVQYVFNKPLGAWAALSWRYDSGLVAGAVPDYATALTLTADQQAAMGLFCGSTFATPRRADHRMRLHGPWRHEIPDSGRRHRRRSAQPAAHRTSPSVRPGDRRGQPAAHGQGEAQGPPERAESHQQGGALQLPVHLQRHALRDAAGGHVPGRRHVLRTSPRDRPSEVGPNWKVRADCCALAEA